MVKIIYIFPYCLKYHELCKEETCRKLKTGEEVTQCEYRIVKEEAKE